MSYRPVSAISAEGEASAEQSTWLLASTLQIVWEGRPSSAAMRATLHTSCHPEIHPVINPNAPLMP